MSNDIAEFEKLKVKLERAKEDLNRLDGQEEVLLRRLHELNGYNSVEEAVSSRNDLIKEMKKLEERRDLKIEKFRKKFNGLLKRGAEA